MLTPGIVKFFAGTDGHVVLAKYLKTQGWNFVVDNEIAAFPSRVESAGSGERLLQLPKLESLDRWVIRIGHGEKQRVTIFHLVGDFLVSAGVVIPLDADSVKSADDFQAGKFPVQRCGKAPLDYLCLLGCHGLYFGGP